MTQRNNLYRRSSGIYVLRISVPVRYRLYAGQREIHASTHSRILREAQDVARALLQAWDACLEGFARMDLATLSGNAPVVSGEGNISIAAFCASFGAEPEAVVQHLYDGNIPVYALAEGLMAFCVDDFTDVDREDETGGFVLNSALALAVERRICGYVKPFDLRYTLGQLLGQGYSEETAFRPALQAGRAACFFDLPGIRLDAATLFFNKVQAESLRSQWTRSLLAAAPVLPALSSSPSVVAPVTPVSPSIVSISPFCNPTHANMTCSELLDKFIAFKNTGDFKLASGDKIRSRVEHFTDCMGDVPLGELDRDVVKRYIAKMQNMPGNLYQMRRKYKTTNTEELIEKALADGQPVMTRDAIGRHLESLGSMLKWACSERYLLTNPAENVLAQRRVMVREQDRRGLFTDEELAQIFAADWFSRGSGTANRYGRYVNFRPYHYWLPLMALYLGGRINELCQLHLSDIRVDKNGIPYVDFNLETPDKMLDSEAGENGGKSLKTVNAIRKVPVHPRLVELGLLSYVKALKAAGHTRLFPELKHNAIKGYRAAASKWFNENYLGKVLNFPRDGTKTFHSFRHTFVTALDMLGTDERMVAQLVGHARGNTTAMTTYRKDADVRVPYAVIARLAYDLQELAPFDSQRGLKAVSDAIRKQKP